MKLGAAGSASCALVRYSGTIENASRSTSGWRVQSTLQSTGVNSHLCGLTTTESASSAPSSTQRSSGTSAALPAYAASTCSQRRCSAQTAAIVATGSTLVLDVVPTVATTATGRWPAAMSVSIAARSAVTSMRNALSTGMRRHPSWPKPSTMPAFSTDECASLLV